MAEATFRFYAELNDFLLPEQRQVDFVHTFAARTTVKDMIEALGVPHTEVDLILVDGLVVDFGAIVEDGNRISVYPVFEALDVGPVARLRAAPLREPKFVLDVHLGRLARYLRLLGFDVLYRRDYVDAELARVSVAERRIVLTQDRGLLKRRVVTHGYCVRASDPRAQAREVVERFDLAGKAAPYTRCVHCNGMLSAVEKADVADRLPARSRDAYDHFWRCCDCGHLYWSGSHQTGLEELVGSMLGTKTPEV